MRTYELMFVVDPRVSDEDVATMSNDYKQMITAGGGGARIAKEEIWGRRKLAYPIEKLNEGKYVLLYVATDDGTSALPAVEHRMRQNDKILRYLTVRTDEELKRAGKPLEPPAGEGPAAHSAEPERGDRDRDRGERGDRGDRDRGDRGDRDRGDRGDRGERFESRGPRED